MGASAARQCLRRIPQRRPAALSGRPLLLTPGEPAGIGPDLCVLLAARRELDDVVVVADADLLAQRAHQLGLHDLTWQVAADLATLADAPQRAPSGAVRVWHQPLAMPATAGLLQTANARYVLDCLDAACDACADGRAAALVTGPVQKSVIAEAGMPFSGHTEYLAARLGVAQVVMLLAGGGLRVALATTHLPLRAVPDAITPALLDAVLAILLHDLRTRFGVAEPRVSVTGLNPHAGESGHLGSEDAQVIAPAIARARARGARVDGPWPADTLFTPKHLEQCDAVLAMYHDQGLPVLKMRSFGTGVNITLGLPIVRTSVDHGTALDLAGSGRVDAGSLSAALAQARALSGA